MTPILAQLTPEQFERIPSTRLRLQAQRCAKVIETLRPFEIDNSVNLDVKRVLVFSDTDNIVLSLISPEGAVNVTLQRKGAADLAAALAHQLSELPVHDDDPPQSETDAATLT